MTKPWQLYDEQGRAISGKGAEPEEVYGQALLHSAAHVWMWRRAEETIEILLQKRANTVSNWPGRYDISAAGHVDLGEKPLAAAVREASEEVGLSVSERDLRFIGVERRYIRGSDQKRIENEFSWLYLLELANEHSFTFGDGEVASVQWKHLEDMKRELADPELYKTYVPHGKTYFNLLFEALEREINN